MNRIQDVCAYPIQYYVNRRVGNTENRSQCLSNLQGKYSESKNIRVTHISNQFESLTFYINVC